MSILTKLKRLFGKNKGTEIGFVPERVSDIVVNQVDPFPGSPTFAPEVEKLLAKSDPNIRTLLQMEVGETRIIKPQRWYGRSELKRGKPYKGHLETPMRGQLTPVKRLTGYSFKTNVLHTTRDLKVLRTA